MDIKTEPSKPKDLPEIHPLTLAEYNTLREEILKRIELRSQITSLSLIILGTILGFGLQAKSASVLLLYPILATFLAANWTHNGKGIRAASIHIRDHIEGRFGSHIASWEQGSRNRPRNKIEDNLNFVSANGIFIVTSVVAIAVACPFLTFTVIDFLLLALAIISFLCSIAILYYPSSRYWR